MITKEQMHAIIKEVIKDARSEAEDYFDGDYCDTILHLVEKRLLQKINQ